MHGKKSFKFGAKLYTAFNTLKLALILAPVTKVYDPELPVRVESDASNTVIGAVLEQKHENV